MITRFACGAFAALSAVVAACPAEADEKVLRAMSSLISAAPPSRPFSGTIVDGSLVIENRSDAKSFVGVFAPGPGLCIVRFQGVSQSQSGWAESVTLAFDFTKIKQVRWLSKADDRASAPSRGMNAPDVQTLVIDAEAPWLCRDEVHLAGSKPAFRSTCANSWTVTVPTSADRTVAAEAVELVRKSCVATKQ